MASLRRAMTHSPKATLGKVARSDPMFDPPTGTPWRQGGTRACRERSLPGGFRHRKIWDRNLAGEFSCPQFFCLKRMDAPPSHPPPAMGCQVRSSVKDDRLPRAEAVGEATEWGQRNGDGGFAAGLHPRPLSKMGADFAACRISLTPSKSCTRILSGALTSL